jgi:hypothetical protein
MNQASSSWNDSCTKEDTVTAIVDRCSLPNMRARLVVKFCERYGGDAHRMLADACLAPKLYYCSEVVGGVFIVVMEQVDGRDAYSEFRQRDLPRAVLDDGKLHDTQLAYGDMRRPIITVMRKPKSRDDNGEGLDRRMAWAVGRL